MVLKDSEKKQLTEVLQEVKPYIAELETLEQLIDQHMESADSIDEFARELAREDAKIVASTPRTDLRIYLGRLRKTIGT